MENLRLAFKAGVDEIGMVSRNELLGLSVADTRISGTASKNQALLYYHHRYSEKLSNARMEAINNKIKLLIRTAYCLQYG